MRTSRQSASLLTLVLLLFGTALALAPSAHAAPQLPQVLLDTSMPPRLGQTITVSATGNIQTAIDSAQPGDTIVLQAGTVYQTVNGIVLRNKNNPQNKWITITTSAEVSLPPADQRINPAIHAAFMPIIESTSGNPLTLDTEAGAGFYRLIGIQFRPQAGKHSNTLLRIGQGSENTIAQLPHDIVLDRVAVLGDPVVGGTRGVALNGRRIAIINSYFDDWKVCGHDGGTAIGGWNSDGIFKVVNNHIAAAGIGSIYGGGTSALNLVPADFEVRQNHFYKKPSWTSGIACGAGSWPAKNAFELKIGKRVLVDGNVLDGNWLAAQTGQIVLLKADQQTLTGPNAPEVGHITFRNNLIYNTGSGFNIVGVDLNNKPDPVINMNNLLIENNVMHTVNVAPFTSTGARFFQFTGGGTLKSKNVTIRHNTFVQDGGLLASFALDTDSVSGLVLRDNIFSRGQYGLFASCGSEGRNALNCGAPGAIVEKNIFIGAPSNNYPANNFYPVNSGAVGFTNLTNNNFALLSSSSYRNAATDGTDIGANVPLVMQFAASATSGQAGPCTDTMWTPDPSTQCGTFVQTSNCGNTRSATGTSNSCGGGGGPVCTVGQTRNSTCANGTSYVVEICTLQQGQPVWTTVTYPQGPCWPGGPGPGPTPSPQPTIIDIILAPIIAFLSWLASLIGL